MPVSSAASGSEIACEDHRRLGILGAYSHDLCCQSRNRDDGVYTVRDSLVANLLQGRLVVLSGINLVMDGYIVILRNLVQLCRYRVGDFIQGKRDRACFTMATLYSAVSPDAASVSASVSAAVVSAEVSALDPHPTMENVSCCRTTKSYQFLQVMLSS